MTSTSTAAPLRRPGGGRARLDSFKNPQPRPLPLSKKQLRAQRQAANNECPNPDCNDKDVGEEDGQLVCRGCGTVVNDSNMVSEVTFGATSNGGHVLHGTHVGADQTFARSGGAGAGRVSGQMDSRDLTEAAGKSKSASCVDV